MEKEVIIIIAEDDDGHAALIQKNLKRSGMSNTVLRFTDGQEVLDLFFVDGNNKVIENNQYILLLDIRMPKIDGIEVLRQVKKCEQLKKLPVIMVTTTDDSREVEKCYSFGCNNYIIKPVDYDQFVNAIRQLGLFLKVVEVPKLSRINS